MPKNLLGCVISKMIIPAYADDMAAKISAACPHIAFGPDMDGNGTVIAGEVKATSKDVVTILTALKANTDVKTAANFMLQVATILKLPDILPTCTTKCIDINTATMKAMEVGQAMQAGQAPPQGDLLTDLFLLSAGLQGHGGKVTAATTAILGAVSTAAIGAQYNWGVEYNVITHGYQRYTQCVANYAQKHADRIEAPNFVVDTVLALPLCKDQPKTCPDAGNATDAPNAYGLTKAQRPAVCLGDAFGVSKAGKAAVVPVIHGFFAKGTPPTDKGFQAAAGGAYVMGMLNTMQSLAKLATSPDKATAIVKEVDPFVANYLEQELHTLTCALDGTRLKAYVTGTESVTAALAKAVEAQYGAAIAQKTKPEQDGAAAVTFVSTLASEPNPQVIGGFLQATGNPTLNDTAKAEAGIAFLMSVGKTQAQSVELLKEYSCLLKGLQDAQPRLAVLPVHIGAVVAYTATGKLGNKTGAAAVENILGALLPAVKSLTAADVASIMVMYGQVVGCAGGALLAIGTGVGSERLFKGNPDADGTATSHPHFSKAYWATATVNFTASPLPRKWGVDRFPCGRASSIDMFREGDFDYPYNLKQAQEIAWQTLMFGSSPFLAGEAAKAQCTDHAVTKPLQQAGYLQTMTFDYTEDNMAAIEAAEQAFGATLGNVNVQSTAKADAAVIQGAGALAAGTYVGAGGGYFHAPSAGNIIKGAADQFKQNPLAFSGAIAGSLGYIQQTQLKYEDPAANAPATVAAFAAHVMATGSTAGFAEKDKMAFIKVVTDNAYLASLYDAKAKVVPSALTTAQFKDATFKTYSIEQVGAALTIGRMIPMMMPWLTTIGTAVGTAVGTERALVTHKDTCGKKASGQFDVALGLFATLGYWWRPSYGEHWSFDKSTDTAIEPLAAVQASLDAYTRDYGTKPWATMMCVAGNTDFATLQGTPMPACMAPWSSTFGMPIDLIMGKLDFNDNSGTLQEKAKSGLKAVGAHRMVVNQFSSFHWMMDQRMDARINGAITDKSDPTYQDTTAQTRNDMIMEAEIKFRDHLLPIYDKTKGSGFAPGEAYDTQSLFFTVDRGTGDVVEEGTEVELPQVIIVYIVVLIYIAVGLWNYSDINLSHVWLGLVGVAVIGLSVASAMGFSAYMKIGWTPLSNNVAPFILLGIGIDDMLVMAHAYAAHLAQDKGNTHKVYHQQGQTGVLKIMQETLEEVGPSITFTSTCNMLAFLLASLVQIKVAQLFCWTMAIGIVTNYVFLLLLFVPLMVVDARRTILGNGSDCCCIGTPQEAKEVPHSGENIVTRFIRTKYGPFLTNPAVKAVVLVLSFTFFGIQLWQFTSETQVGIRNTDITKDGTYQNAFYNRNELDFTMYGVSQPARAASTKYIKGTAWDSKSVQINIQMAAKNMPFAPLVEKSGMAVGQGGSWMTSVIASAPADCQGERQVTIKHADDDYCDYTGTGYTKSTTYKYLDEGQFYPAFGAYLSGLGALGASNFVCKNTTTDEITPCFDVAKAYGKGGDKDVILAAATAGSYLRNQLEIDNFLDGIKDTRKFVDSCYDKYASGEQQEATKHTDELDSMYWTYAGGYTFKFYCQYLYSYRDMFTAVGFSVLGCFIASLIFSASPQSCVVLALTIFKTIIELAGVIPESSLSMETGLKLNAFSLVNLCLAVGMTVEFTGHIVREFLVSKPDDDKKDGYLASRDSRVQKALESLGTPVLHGIVTSLITTLFLALSNTAFIRQYYFFMFFFMLVIASINGLVFLPVMLTLFGDEALETEAQDRKESLILNTVREPEKHSTMQG